MSERYDTWRVVRDWMTADLGMSPYGYSEPVFPSEKEKTMTAYPEVNTIGHDNTRPAQPHDSRGPTPAGTVTGMISMLSGQLDALGRVTTGLRDALEPVLSPSPGEDPPMDAIAADCEVAGALRSLLQQATGLTAMIEGIRSRVAL